MPVAKKINSMTVTNSDSQKSYKFLFEPALEKDLLIISFAGFIDAYRAIDAALAEKGSNKAKELYFIFVEPELGLIQIKVTYDDRGEQFNTEMVFLDSMGHADPENEYAAYLLK